MFQKNGKILVKDKKKVEKSQVTDIRMKTKPSLCCGH